MLEGPATLSGVASWLRRATSDGQGVTISAQLAAILADAADKVSDLIMEGKAR